MASCDVLAATNHTQHSLESVHCRRRGELTISKSLNPTKIAGDYPTTAAATGVAAVAPTCAVFLEGKPPRKSAKPLRSPGKTMSYVDICEQRYCCIFGTAHHAHAALTATSVEVSYSRPPAVGSGFTRTTLLLLVAVSPYNPCDYVPFHAHHRAVTAVPAALRGSAFVMLPGRSGACRYARRLPAFFGASGATTFTACTRYIAVKFSNLNLQK